MTTECATMVPMPIQNYAFRNAAPLHNRPFVEYSRLTESTHGRYGQSLMTLSIRYLSRHENFYYRKNTFLRRIVRRRITSGRSNRPVTVHCDQQQLDGHSCICRVLSRTQINSPITDYVVAVTDRTRSGYISMMRRFLSCECQGSEKCLL